MNREESKEAIKQEILLIYQDGDVCFQELIEVLQMSELQSEGTATVMDFIRAVGELMDEIDEDQLVRINSDGEDEDLSF